MATSSMRRGRFPLGANLQSDRLTSDLGLCKASRCKHPATEGDNMDLHEQANEALDALLAKPPFDVGDDWKYIARMMWFAGYEAGTSAAKAQLNDAFAQWQAAQS